VKWSGEEVAAIVRLYPSATHPELLAALPGRSIRIIQCKANELGLKRVKRPSRTAEEVRQAKREFMARRRAEDPERARAYQREFHHRNGERNREKMRAYASRRFFWNRANKLRSATAASFNELAGLWKKQRGLCALTGERLTRQNAELDHIIPKARGGDDSLSNLRWVTKEVNRAKRDLTDAEFIALCGNVMRWIGRRIEMVEEIAREAA
jgi:5-methylcytosine-specific restriction endonuclease McrA